MSRNGGSRRTSNASSTAPVPAPDATRTRVLATDKIIVLAPASERLPIEVVLMIIQAHVRALPDRLIQVLQQDSYSDYYGTYIPAFFSRCRIPSAFHVSHLWREEMLKSYVMSFGLDGIAGEAWQDQILINWEKDVICFRKDIAYRHFTRGVKFRSHRVSRNREDWRCRVNGVSNVQRLAFVCYEEEGFQFIRPARATVDVVGIPGRLSLREITFALVFERIGPEPVLRVPAVFSRRDAYECLGRIEQEWPGYARGLITEEDRRLIATRLGIILGDESRSMFLQSLRLIRTPAILRRSRTRLIHEFRRWPNG
ncbi:uncharacterized protein RSE6_08106 [Rhynchosporium secalis]|uniref:Uncharacterized protein n=1 Tax=Rhynchosporium secalis TaxID=38038 RepID=A0A1E1MFN9_RHYSE|nr:uncharacterized protein RSE6_08106 [Rhynchosporium secalis]